MMIYIIYTSSTKLCVEKAPECDKCTLWSLRCVDIRLFDPHLHNYVFYLSFSLFSSCDRALISFFPFPIVLKAEDGTMVEKMGLDFPKKEDGDLRLLCYDAFHLIR